MSKHVGPIYQSFLVRCWFVPPEKKDSPPAWRFELREVTTGNQGHGFSDIEQLKDFIASKLAAAAQSNEQERDEDKRKTIKRKNIERRHVQE